MAAFAVIFIPTNERRNGEALLAVIPVGEILGLASKGKIVVMLACIGGSLCESTVFTDEPSVGSVMILRFITPAPI